MRAGPHARHLAAAALALVGCLEDEAALAPRPAPDAATPVLCEEAEPVVLEATGPSAGGFEGLLVTGAPSGRVFEVEDGTRLDVDTPKLRRGTGGEPLWGRLEVGPDGRRLSLWYRDAAGAPRGLARLIWTGRSFDSGSIGGFEYAYVASECVAEDGCGAGTGLALRVRGRSGAGVFEPGQAWELASDLDETTEGVAYNGASVQPAPGCGEARVGGWLGVSDPVARCTSLRRDTCIWTPECVLWGSETLDPDYRCGAAQGPCEVNPTLEACEDNPACAWAPGDCYCPENADCECEGGPAPKCLERCALQGPAEVCGAHRFCEIDRMPAPECAPRANPTGRCQERPRPRVCFGAPLGEVCACAGPGAQTFANDCVRRSEGASGSTVGPCP